GRAPLTARSPREAPRAPRPGRGRAQRQLRPSAACGPATEGTAVAGASPPRVRQPADRRALGGPRQALPRTLLARHYRPRPRGQPSVDRKSTRLNQSLTNLVCPLLLYNKNLTSPP